MTHHCHAKGCSLTVPPRLLMCRKHWAMVPKPLQAQVWRTYRSGQEKDKKVSLRYLTAHYAAINFVAAKEGKELIDVRQLIEGLRHLRQKYNLND